MYSSHSFPYQLGSNQPTTQPAQYSSFTPQPTPQYPSQPSPRYPSQPSPRYPSQPSPQYPSQPSSQYPQPPRPPLPQYPQPPQPQPPQPPQPQPVQQQPSSYTPADSLPVCHLPLLQRQSPVSMPQLHRQTPDQSTGSSTTSTSQQIGDTRFVLLWSMDTEELTAVLEDKEKFNEMVVNMEEVKQKKLEKEMSMAENRSLADFNLSREPRLNEGRAQFIARLHEAHRLKDSYTVGKSKLDSLREQNSLDTALALMQANTAKAEEESEEVADDFLKGDLMVEDFLDKFMSKRQTAHLRHIKAEKMQELLNGRQRASSTASSSQQGMFTQHSSMPPYANSAHPQTPISHYQPNLHGNLPYGYQPKRPAPGPPPGSPYIGPRYGPGAPTSMPTLGSYPQ